MEVAAAKKLIAMIDKQLLHDYYIHVLLEGECGDPSFVQIWLNGNKMLSMSPLIESINSGELSVVLKEMSSIIGVYINICPIIGKCSPNYACAKHRGSSTLYGKKLCKL